MPAWIGCSGHLSPLCWVFGPWAVGALNGMLSVMAQNEATGYQSGSQRVIVSCTYTSMRRDIVVFFYPPLESMFLSHSAEPLCDQVTSSVPDKRQFPRGGFNGEKKRKRPGILAPSPNCPTSAFHGPSLLGMGLYRVSRLWCETQAHQMGLQCFLAWATSWPSWAFLHHHHCTTSAPAHLGIQYEQAMQITGICAKASEKQLK